MWTTILGWASLVLTLLGAAVFAFGCLDMGRQSGEAKMGGAILTMAGIFLVIPGIVLGIIWLAVT